MSGMAFTSFYAHDFMSSSQQAWSLGLAVSVLHGKKLRQGVGGSGEDQLTCSQVRAVSLREIQPPSTGPTQGLVRTSLLFGSARPAQQASGFSFVRTAGNGGMFSLLP